MAHRVAHGIAARRMTSASCDPQPDLGTGFADFHDAAKLHASYQLGVEQATQGWSPYALPTA
jgi:hypothetical protein